MSLKNYITPKGFQKLKDEYHQLGSIERPKVVETVAWAASNGDRSENADYQYGKKRLREIDRRLHFLKNRLEIAEVVDPTKVTSKQILFGATVFFEDEEGKEFKYQIVGEDEIDASLGKISWKSPVAKALLGKKVEDEVSIERPSGLWNVIITKIQYISI